MIIYAGSVGSGKNGTKGSLSGHGEGISVLEWKEECFVRRNVYGLDNASFLTISPNGEVLYVLSESKDFGGMNGSGGGITAYRIQKDGRLEKINDSLSYGSRPAYISPTADGKYLLAANHGSHTTVTCHYVQDEAGEWKLQRGFDDSSLAVFSLHSDGSIGSLSDLMVFHGHGYWCYGGGQSASHLHSVIVRGNLVIAANRGADRIEILHLDEETGKLTLLNRYHVRSAYAPRYAVFHPFADWLYVVNENYPAVSVYALNQETGQLQEKQMIGTMPVSYYEAYPLPYYEKWEADREEVNTSGMADRRRILPSDIHMTSDGKYLFVSNRGLINGGSLTSFSVKEDGTLEYQQNLSLEGKDPRGFMITKDNRHLIVGLCDADKVQIFSVENGNIGKKEAELEMNSPSCFAVG